MRFWKIIKYLLKMRNPLINSILDNHRSFSNDIMTILISDPVFHYLYNCCHYSMSSVTNQFLFVNDRISQVTISLDNASILSCLCITRSHKSYHSSAVQYEAINCLGNWQNTFLPHVHIHSLPLLNDNGKVSCIYNLFCSGCYEFFHQKDGRL